MASSKKVYIARSGFYAFIDRAHPKYDQASAYFRYFSQEGYTLYTDSMTLIDVYNQIYKEISPSLAKDFLRERVAIDSSTHSSAPSGQTAAHSPHSMQELMNVLAFRAQVIIERLL